ncbi:MAG: hypothetical protein Q7O66_10095 [Dehalococcoidia bacterium]|nr:hypothetical protein [Dehalococcoidia bacterium]
MRLRVEGADSVALSGDQLAITTVAGKFVLPLFPLLVSDHETGLGVGA